MTGPTGGCACGKVRFAAAAAPNFAYVCHCRACQRLSGGGHSVAAAFDKAQVTITGAPAAFTRASDSGHKVMQHFCADCGSPLFNTMTRAEGMMMINLGAFDNPNAAAPDRVFHAEDAPHWDLMRGTGADG